VYGAFVNAVQNRRNEEDESMFDLLSTLMRGANARAVETVTDAFAVDLIDQKVREAEAGVAGAKRALAALILRQRTEQQAHDALRARIAALEDRVRKALAADDRALAAEGAAAIADMENELAQRTEVVSRLGDRVHRLRLSVEKAHRRVIDLRQGAVTARAFDLERRSQRGINRAVQGSAIDEAEALIKRVVDQDDPFAEAEIAEEIDASLSNRATEDRLAAAGFGPRTRVLAEDVLLRLRGPEASAEPRDQN
jgi:phage shock protein A